MKWCPSCRKEFADEVNFCKFCGARLEEKIKEEKNIEENKPEKAEEKAFSSADEEKEGVGTEPSEKKDASFYKKMLLVAGIVIVLLVAVLFFRSGKGEDAADEPIEIATEGTEIQPEEIPKQPKEEEAIQPEETEIGRVQTAGGADFYVPEGFVQVEQNITFADVYRYENEGLGMYIEVWEIPFSAVSETETPQEIIKKDYYQSLNVYGGFVGYSVERDDFCVCSANDGDEITYMKFINVRDEIYSTVSFAYPVETRETCDSILEEFLDTLEYD